MALTWMRVDLSLFDHPKVRRLERSLGAMAPLYLLKLWRWAILYAPDGDLSRHDPVDVAVGCDFDGEPADLLKALEAAKLVTRGDDGLRINDWDEHQGRALMKAKQDRERKREDRERRKGGEVVERVTSKLEAAGIRVTEAQPGEPGGPPPSRMAEIFAVIERDWPQQPIASDIAVQRALHEMERTLPDPETFAANLRAWKKTDQWQRGMVPNPETYIRKGTCRNPPPKPKRSEPIVSVDDARVTTESDIERAWREGRLSEGERDALIERARKAERTDQLRQIVEEVARARGSEVA